MKKPKSKRKRKPILSSPPPIIGSHEEKEPRTLKSKKIKIENSDGFIKNKKRRGKKKSTSSSSSSSSPFPNYSRPTPEEAYQALEELESVHGKIQKPKSTKDSIPVLDSLIRTILSQNTTDITSARAFSQLKTRFPKFEDIEKASLKAIEAEIKCCGLAEKRAQVIQTILHTLRKERNELSLEYLHHYNDEDVKKELCRFKGVGPKTAACVLMFCLCRPEFPVDTHVWRITKNLKWVPSQSASREQTYMHLNARIPDEIKYQLHVLLVDHGKCCKKCAKNHKPRRQPIDYCPLTFSNSGSSTSKTKKKKNNLKVVKTELIKVKIETKVRVKKECM